MVANDPATINVLRGGSNFRISAEIPTGPESYSIFEDFAASVAKHTGQQVNFNLILDGPVDGEGSTQANVKHRTYDSEPNKGPIVLQALHAPNGQLVRASRIIDPNTTMNVRDELDALASSFSLNSRNFNIVRMLNDTKGAAIATALASSGVLGEGGTLVQAIGGTGWNVLVGTAWRSQEGRFANSTVLEDWKELDPNRTRFAALEGAQRDNGNCEVYLAGGKAPDVGFKQTGNHLLSLIRYYNRDNRAGEVSLKAALEILQEVKPDLRLENLAVTSLLEDAKSDDAKLTNEVIIKEAIENRDPTAIALCLHQARRHALRLQECAGANEPSLYALDGGFAKGLYNVEGTRDAFLAVVNKSRPQNKAELVVTDWSTAMFDVFRKFDKVRLEVPV